MKSTRNGNWFDASCWDTGKVPVAADDVVLEHYMTADKSIIRENRLYSRKGGVEFINVDMTKFVGGGHSPYEISNITGQPLHVTDVGLWVFGEGYLDLRGKIKTGWLTVTESILPESTRCKLKVTGWSIGDRIAFAPNELDATKFSETILRGVTADEIIFDPVGPGHGGAFNPRSGKTYYTQVLNLSRNEVYIKGTATGQSHVLISSTKPSFIEHVLFQHMGPRKEQRGNDDRSEFVLGRYPIHFHHSKDGSAGSKVTGNVCVDCPSHCYVPHGSHDINFFDNISYRTLQTPYWVDLGHETDGINYDHNFAGDADFIWGSKNLDMEDPLKPQDTPPTFAVHGFEMGKGKRLVARNNCVAGIRNGDPKTGAAYNWESNNELDEWIFENNIAHNNYNGLRDWQNTRTDHLIRKFVSYNGFLLKNDFDVPERINIYNGAYGNPYRYIECECFNGTVIAKAASHIYDYDPDGYGQIWDMNIFDTFYLAPSPVPGDVNIQLWRSKVGEIINDSGIAGDTGLPQPHGLDVVNCEVGTIRMGPNAGPTESIRVQNDNEIYKLTKFGRENIAKFNFNVSGSVPTPIPTPIPTPTPIPVPIPTPIPIPNPTPTPTPTPMPPNNFPPIANAGQDITITLPQNSVQLIGTGSDREGPVTFLWSKVNSPGSTIVSPNSKDTLVNNLSTGVHTFKLVVTDAGNQTDSDQVVITVKAAAPGPVPIPPVVVEEFMSRSGKIYQLQSGGTLKEK